MSDCTTRPVQLEDRSNRALRALSPVRCMPQSIVLKTHRSKRFARPTGRHSSGITLLILKSLFSAVTLPGARESELASFGSEAKAFGNPPDAGDSISPMLPLCKANISHCERGLSPLIRSKLKSIGRFEQTRWSAQ